MNTPTTHPPAESEILYQYDDFYLTKDGRCFHGNRQVDWYNHIPDRKPLIPEKRRTFVSLIKSMIRDGDITYK